MTLTYIIVFSILGSLISLLMASMVLIFSDRILNIVLPVLVSYAIGTLLGAAFLGLIPHMLEDIPLTEGLMTLVLGILLFFILEKLVIWRHCHREECEVHETSGPLILIGDAFHNLVDGIVIAAAFVTSIPLGISTSISVVAHEIPQEVGDFAILIHNKYSRKKAFGLNIVSGSTALVGSVIAYFFLSSVTSWTPYIMGLSAGSFIYIAMADLIPGLNKVTGLKDSLFQVIMIFLGVATIFLFHLHPHAEFVH